MSQWYFSYEGKQIGPLDHADAVKQARQNQNGFCWRQGLAEWIPITHIAELFEEAPPAMPAPKSPPKMADEIDYKIFGESTQYVEVELDPGESAIAEAGSMMYKESFVQMNTIFGDGSHAEQSKGFLGKLVGAGKRLITGESMFTTIFSHTGPSGKARVAFAAPYPGTIIPVTLSNYGGRIICQKDSFLCAARGVSIGIHFQKKIMTGLFGGEGFIMQKLEGDGLAFLHAGGTIIERDLQAGESLQVDTGCLVALTDSIHYDVQMVSGIKSVLFGGEGLFLAHLNGPGRIWLQSLPFSRLAGRVLAAMPASGGSREEGSILGGLGNLLDGDSNF
jgi:uncharacterized protein (TIGR00266 family)